MKIQSLSIIFIIIIMPLTLVINTYIDNRIECAELELEYDTRLLNATYDAVKAYQLNTVNNQFGDVTNEKVDDIEAAVETLKNSLLSSFNYSGYQASVLDEYIPAVVFTTYDGYYVYSPYMNTLTNMIADNDPSAATAESSYIYDHDYSVSGKETTGLKPYVTYSCEYSLGDNNNFVITYTLDNYITIQGLLGGTYHYDYGYLYNITTSSTSTSNAIYYDERNKLCIYDGITFSASDTEEMKEYVGDQEYSYIKINGTKYYLDEHYYDLNGDGVSDSNDEDLYNADIDVDGLNDSITVDASAGIFYIDSSGYRNYSQAKFDTSDPYSDDSKRFVKYYYAIKNNNSAYEYFKNAYEFSYAVLRGSSVSGYTDKAGEAVGSDYVVLKSLTWGDAVIWSNSADDTTSLQEYASAGGTSGSTVIFDTTNAVQLSTSNFNEHRKAIIRYTIETNLVSAIASFSSTKASSFLMPNISEDDWDIIENDVCAISFMQGMSIGTKQYNGYAVVANTLTNDYVDENDIYILGYNNSTGNYVYCKANDGTLLSGEVSILTKNASVGSTSRNYYSGIWKINFETKQYANENSTAAANDDTIYYIPMTYSSGVDATTRKSKAALLLW